MKLNGIDFGVVHGASGVQNFFGEGWSWHKYLTFWFLGPFRLLFDGMTFTSKTTTLPPREGNMPLKEESTQPMKMFPAAIWVSFFWQCVVNSIGLSGPGARVLLDAGQWQKRTEPFFISFMSLGKEVHDRMAELRGFIDLLKTRLPEFNAPVGLILNLSCPNVDHGFEDVLAEARRALDMLAELGIPVLVKLSVTTRPEVAVEIAKHPACSGIKISNTVRWGESILWAPANLQINWWKFRMSYISPVAWRLKDARQVGGISGRPITMLVRAWVQAFRKLDAKTPVCAGGGVLTVADAVALMELGANAVFLGSVAILRPWNVQKIIRVMNNTYGRKAAV